MAGHPHRLWLKATVLPPHNKQLPAPFAHYDPYDSRSRVTAATMNVMGNLGS